MNVNISEASDVYGTLVLGTHALVFAKGPSVEAEFRADARTFEYAGFTCEYFHNAINRQSFLTVGGVELELAVIPEADELFALNMAQFSIVQTGPKVLTLDPGLIALIAPTQWGKSTTLYGALIDAISNGLGASSMCVNYLEVFEDTFDHVIMYTAREKRLLMYMLRALATPGTVLTVDSLRAFVYGKSVGGTGTAGLDQYFSVQLTALSNVFAVCGSMILVTINPMVDYEEDKDRKKYEEIVNQLVASTSCAIVGTSSRQADVYPRGFSNPNRGSFSIRIEDIKKLRELAGKKNTQPKNPVEEIVSGPSAVDNATVVVARRLLRSASENSTK